MASGVATTRRVTKRSGLTRQSAVALPFEMISSLTGSIGIARLCSAVLLLITATTTASAQTLLRTISVSTVGGEALVTIEANGPLPPPTMGALDGPPRIFLDFTGVRLRTTGVARSSDPRIKRVRVGTFSLDPLITRVVIDLVALQPHRIEVATGRVLLFIGTAATPASAASNPALARDAAAPKPTATTSNGEPRPASMTTPPSAPPKGDRIPPVPPLPPSVTEPNDGNRAPARSSSPNSPPAPRAPYRPPTPPPPSKDLEKYRAQAATILDRLKLQLPLLESMESLEDDMASRMPAAMEEFDRLRDELSAIRPPETLRAQHDLLLQAARLGSTAARLRFEAVQSGNNALRRNAASAAAGATLLLDRAFAEIGYVAQESR